MSQSPTKLAIIFRGRSLPSYLQTRSRKKTILSLYQVDVQGKHAQKEKHLNSTKRNVKGRIRAIFCCVLVDVCCSLCSLWDLVASQSSQLLQFVFLLIFFSWGTLARTITSWSLMRPRKIRLKIPISFAYRVKG